MGCRRSVLPARLVIDLPTWVGDQVMALPAVCRLVRANQGQVTVLNVRPPMQRLFAEIFVQVQVQSSRRRAFPFLNARQLCRDGGRFDVGVTLRHASRAKLLLCCAARRTYGSSTGGGRFLLSTHFEEDRSRHQVFDSDQILVGMGLDGVEPYWRPNLPDSLRSEGRRLLDRAGVQPVPLVGLAPAATGGVSKRWSPENFGRLARRLGDDGHQLVILIGPGEDALAGEVVAAAGAELPVVGADVDVAGLAGAMSHLDLLVSNDSGPMHVASMVGTPVVALFGPTEPGRTAPLGSEERVISLELDCSGCRQSVCPLGHNDCLRQLSVDRVHDAVREALRRDSLSPAPSPG